MTTVHEHKQQERLARRRRIQQAAREVFADKGYSKTSIEQVARRATLSVGAIYLYFRSKEDLYVSLLEELFTQLDQDLTQADSTGGLPAMWEHLVVWAQDNREATHMLRLLSREGIRKQLSDEVASAAVAGLSAIRVRLAASVKAGIDAGRYQQVAPEETAEVLWSVFVGTMMHMDANSNLEMSGLSFATAARAGFNAIVGGLRASSNRVKEAA